MSKKVLIICNNAKGLIKFRLHLLKELAKLGFTIVVCLPMKDEMKGVENTLKELNFGIKFFRLKRAGLNVFSDLLSFIDLYKIINFEKPRIILNYTIKPVIYGSLASKLVRVTNVFSFITGLGYVFTNKTLKTKILRKLVEFCYILSLKFNQKIFFLNPDDQNLFVKNNLVNKDKTVVIYGEGVDVEYYTVVPLPKTCTFLLIARLIADKGIYEYISAAKDLKKKYPEAIFMLVGGLDENPSSLSGEELKELENDCVINYLGFIDDIRIAFQNSSVFVLPSYREGTPRSTLEAMAMGRPIITTDAPGCRETVKDGVNGFLVPVKDIDKLRYAMEQFILHNELISRMGLESRKIVEEKFDVHKVNEVILKTICV
jgi:glycosyltransferase involved in cell wall biosynthesis